MPTHSSAHHLLSATSCRHSQLQRTSTSCPRVLGWVDEALPTACKQCAGFPHQNPSQAVGSVVTRAHASVRSRRSCSPRQPNKTVPASKGWAACAGFSQGATAAAILLADLARSRPELLPAFAILVRLTQCAPFMLTTTSTQQFPAYLQCCVPRFVAACVVSSAGSCWLTW